MQVHDTDWWKQELLQDASLQISITGTFVDDGVLAGEADTGDVMQYEFIVRNIGSVTLRNVGEMRVFVGALSQFRGYPSRYGQA